MSSKDYLTWYHSVNLKSSGNLHHVYVMQNTWTKPKQFADNSLTNPEEEIETYEKVKPA